ncbi:MHS family proline/betaine transporter-like MFS transporter [Sphingopyxis sp. OAS728]|nr:MHS family proline/betaine transporter-like MFS transporter [Sphingopyxis sp. OAS728]
MDDLTRPRVSAPAAAEAASSRVRPIAAAVAGNVLEWFDIALFGYYSTIIATLFFPVGNAAVATLFAVGTYGLGFVIRPVGAVVLGSLGDTRGRKAALTITIATMALGTAAIGLAPTYERAGIVGPIVIVLARLLQGFSAGGEMGSATAFLFEHAAPNRRAFAASFQQASQALAMLLGSLSAAAVASFLTPEQALDWGWRVPFLAGLMIAPIGIYIRRRTHEPAEFEAARAQAPLAAHPVRILLRDNRADLLVGFGLFTCWAVLVNFFLIFMPTHAVTVLGIGQADALYSNCITLLLVLILTPLFGLLADRIGTISLQTTAALVLLLGSLPALEWLAAAPSAARLLAVQLAIAVPIAAFTGPAPAALARLFPVQIRSTGMAISHSVAGATFGGLAPFATTSLTLATGNPASPAWYIMFACCAALAALAASRRLVRTPVSIGDGQPKVHRS